MTHADTILIVPVGDDMKSLQFILPSVNATVVYLLSPLDRLNEAVQTQKKLSAKNISCHVMDVKGDIWMDFFAKVGEIKEAHKNHEVIVVTATGDKLSSCAMTSAAFVNGLKALSVDGNKPMMLPVMKFSYYKLLSDKKLKLLAMLDTSNPPQSPEELSKQARMSLPLISYHLNGNLKSEGLKQLGLVVTKKVEGKKMGTKILQITPLGKMLLYGYVKMTM